MKSPLVVLLACSFLRHLAADTFTVTNTNDSGTGSLRQAIMDANSHPNSAKPLVVLLACSFLRHLAADTFTVTNTNDSGTGSLRQAIMDANSHPNSANPGSAADLISFAIGGSGTRTISPTSALPTITEAVILNGYTQPGASPNTLTSGFNGVLLIELNGTNAGNNVAGLTIGGGGSTIRGLVINSFRGFGMAITSGTGGHTIQGNFIGTDVTGTQPLGNLNNGIDITASPQVTIGGTGPGDGNLVSANDGNAIWIHTGSDEATLQGNRIGTNAAGTAVLLGPGQTDQSNTGDGIILESNSHTVGGDEEGARNIIAACSGDAILMQNSNENTTDGNSIGTDATGTIKMGNHSGAGVRITDGTDNTVGGFLAGEGNLMADNFLGVEVDSFSGPALNNTISGNSIFSSRNGLGIDLDTLAGSGVTPNDPGDTDTGPNNFQNFPVITSATYSPGKVQVAGTLNSMSSQTYRIELFGNFVANSSGFGEGHYFLDSFTVMTDGSGNASFNRTPSTLAPVNFVSATATDSAGNTSEFAQDVAVANAPGRLINLSTRALVMTGDNVTIGGLIISGKSPKRVVLRGLGPSLPSSVPNRLGDPVLNLYKSGSSTPIATNNDWKTNQAAVQATGLAPTNDLEAAIVTTLAPGTYTVLLSGNGGGTGIGLVEIYDVTPDSESGLFNTSGRTLVGNGDNILIGGITIGGSGSMAFVVTAKGPSLPVGSSTLPDPTLSLYDASGTLIAFNDDWQDDVNHNQIPTNIRPADTREGGLYRVLGPGVYTAIVRGKGGATGIGLVEIWDVN